MERLYLDTSVFGGYFELEFEVWTTILFNRIKSGQYRLVFSKVTEFELMNAPERVKKLAMSIPSEHIDIVEVTDEAATLADMYITEKVVGETSRADCLHIAVATLCSADILVSWNFKHIVNINRIRGYNSVNYKNGYKILEIRTPREILEYES